MKQLVCGVYNLDLLTQTVVEGFVTKTNSLCLYDPLIHTNDPDVLFFDTISEYQIPFNSYEGKFVIISSNVKNIHSYFKNQISDFLHLPDLTYARFLESVKLIGVLPKL